MKKIIIILLFLFIPTFTFATSGACSDHGGVNCDAGMNSFSGNAICNDWTNSSISYIDMKECMNGAQCTEAERKSLQEKDGYTEAWLRAQSDAKQINDIETQIQNKIQAQLNEIASSGGVANKSEIYADVLSQNPQLTEKESSLSEDERNALDVIDLVTPAVNQDCHSSAVQDILNQNQKILNNQKQQPQIAPQVINTAPQQTTPPVISSTSCPNGYVFNREKNKCTTKKEQCLDVWGEHTHPADKISTILSKVSGCDCDDGYIWTEYKDAYDKCALIIQPATQGAVVTGVDNKQTTTNIQEEQPTKTQIQTPAQPKNKPQTKSKHWYDWLNPFNWFAK